MAGIQIGVVQSLQGQVYVTHADGAVEKLQEGSDVFLNDVVTTGNKAAVLISFLDGSEFKIGPAFTAILNTEVFDPSGYLVAGETTGEVVTISHIGEVTGVEGDVKVVRNDGSVQTLSVGDFLYANDIVITAAESSAAAKMLDGSEMDFGPDFTAFINDDLFPSRYPEYVQAGLTDAEIIRAAILAGQDPADVGKAPAAGTEVTEDAGNSIVVIEDRGRQVTPESGHETTGLGYGFSEMEELLQSEEFAPPVAGEAAVLRELDEALLDDGAVTRTTQLEFTAGSNDIVSFSINDLSDITVNTNGTIGADVEWVKADATTLEGYVNGELALTVTLSGNSILARSIGEVTVTGKLTENFLHEPTQDSNELIIEGLKIVATDNVGNSATGSVNVIIIDSTPAAQDDLSAIDEDALAPVTGNVLTNDSLGADKPPVFEGWTSTEAVYGTFTDTSGGGYSYALNPDNQVVQSLDDDESLSEIFEYTMLDADGDRSTATLTITINGGDDPLVAQDDTDSFSEAAVEGGATVDGTINVLSNDSDPDATDNPLVVQAATVDALAADGTTVLGTVAFATDGTYTLTLNTAGQAAASALDDTESLSVTADYTAENQDGATEVATLTITINGVNDIPKIVVDPGNPDGANDKVYEKGLPDGTAPEENSEFAHGTFTISDADGLDDLESVTINNNTVLLNNLVGSTFAGDNGTLTITAYNETTGIASYEYELTSPTTDLEGVESDEFTLTVSDGSSSSDPANIFIEIVDDVPEANIPQNAVLANELGNSLTASLNVTMGADGPAAAIPYALTGLVAGTLVLGTIEVFGAAETVTLTSEGIDLEWRDNGDGSWSAVRVTDSNEVFSITPNLDGTYTVALSDTYPLDGGFDIVPISFASGVTGGNSQTEAYFNGTEPDTDGDNVPDDATLMVFASGLNADGTIGTINGSTQGLGVSQGNSINTLEINGIEQSEQLTLWFKEPSDPTLIDNPATEGTAKEIDFAKITFDLLDGAKKAGDSPEYAIVIVHINDGSADGRDVFFKVAGFGTGAGASDEVDLVITQGLEGNGTTGGDGLTEATAYVVDMGLLDGRFTGTVEIDGLFDHLHFQAEADSADGVDSDYRLLSIQGFDDTVGNDIYLNMNTAEATDGDGDSVATGEFQVIFDAGNFIDGTTSDNGTITDFDDVIQGNGVGDIINGLGGDDIIFGDGGDDTMTGGDGSDTYIWLEGETGRDTITDFHYSPVEGEENDVLNLADLLQGETSDNLGDYLSIAYDVSEDFTTITAYVNGDGADPVQEIILGGVDLSGSSLEFLLGNGNLVITETP